MDVCSEVTRMDREPVVRALPGWGPESDPVESLLPWLRGRGGRGLPPHHHAKQAFACLKLPAGLLFS